MIDSYRSWKSNVSMWLSRHVAQRPKLSNSEKLPLRPKD